MVSGNSEDPFHFWTDSMELTAEAEVPTIPEYETILSKYKVSKGFICHQHGDKCSVVTATEKRML